MFYSKISQNTVLLLVGENPLVTMPHKYTQETFNLVSGRLVKLSDKEQSVIER